MNHSNGSGEKIRKFILDHFPLSREQNFSDDDSLLGRGFLDSLGVLELVQFVENEFKITVTDEDLLPDHFQSINSLSSYIEKKMGTR